MATPAYDDLRMNTLIAGYGQIRHNYVLMAGQAYDEGGCVIPDGWVEPLPAVYDGIASYADRGAAVMKQLETSSSSTPGAKSKNQLYFEQLGTIARVLGTIARHELEGRALSLDEKRFLSMVVELVPGSTGSAPTYTGWYFDLFRGRWEEGLAPADFIADYYTSSWKQEIVYAGALAPRMGIFVIDAGGPPRLAVGPVAHAFETRSRLVNRLDDRSGPLAPNKQEPWSASYTAAALPEPGVAAAFSISEDGKDARIVLRSGASPIASVVIELLDHHRVPIVSTTRALGANAKVVLKLKAPRTSQGLRLRIGEFAAERFVGGPESSGSIERGGVAIDPGDFSP